MKVINENTLRKVIKESILEHLNESSDDLDIYNESFDDILMEAKIVADRYENYAYQIRECIEYTKKIYQEIIQEINKEFNTNINVQSCSLQNGELEINFAIPVQNFLVACKQNEHVIDDIKYSESQTDNDFIECGLYSDWDDLLAYVGDRQHNVVFHASKVNGNMVECYVTVSDAIITWD